MHHLFYYKRYTVYIQDTVFQCFFNKLKRIGVQNSKITGYSWEKKAKFDWRK